MTTIRTTTTTHACPECRCVFAMTGDTAYRSGVCECGEVHVFSHSIGRYVEITPGCPDIPIIQCADCGGRVDLDPGQDLAASWICGSCHMDRLDSDYDY